MEYTVAKYDYLIKMLIIGDQAVGKTCILLRFADDNFTFSHIATIGIDFKNKIMPIDGKTVKLQIWDTAGQERFRTITQTYYKGAMGVIVSFDVTNRDTFSHVKDWLEQINMHASTDVAKVLIATKCDLQNRAVTYEEGKSLAAEMGIPYYETSAKSNTNIKEVFVDLAKMVMDRGLCERPNYNHLKVDETSQKKKSCCSG